MNIPEAPQFRVKPLKTDEDTKAKAKLLEIILNKCIIPKVKKKVLDHK